jgi:hypothetical protein
MQFIRFIRPRRLKEVTVRDVTDWLRLISSQPGAEAWQVQQADRALRVLHYSYRTEETYLAWAVRFLAFAGAP